MCCNFTLFKYINRRNRISDYDFNNGNNINETNETTETNETNTNLNNSIFLSEFCENRIVRINSKINKCIICFERYIQTELSCNHKIMCYRCVYEWFINNKKNTCPLCRKIVIKINVVYRLSFTL